MVTDGKSNKVIVAVNVANDKSNVLSVSRNVTNNKSNDFGFLAHVGCWPLGGGASAPWL